MDKIPWENRDYLGYFRAMFLNIKECLGNPREHFSKVIFQKNYSSSIFYIWIISSVSSLSYIFFDYFLTHQFTLFILKDINKSFKIFLDLREAYVIFFLLVPLFTILNVFLVTLIFYIITYLMKKKIDYKKIFQLLSYTKSSTIFFPIPYLGNLIEPIINLYLTIIAFRSVYKFSFFQSMLIALSPLFFVVFFLIMLTLIGK